ncbi:unnamed protein product [Orchesella dallaii]|uniref:GTP-binding protein Di-Ras2 n=1 Tax=Orchesella dallaii TaxID=48710 RepID=A0ABP1RL81_9HEXA
MITKMGDLERIRLVILGGPKVGKSAIVKRFLFGSFMEKYKPTVEDLYSKEYDFGRITLKVDILDTAGDLQFPAMRRLSIATAHAFLLVYAIDDVSSFETVKGCFQEIREQRADFQEVPIVVAGNKMDVELTSVEVEFDDVSDWLSIHLPMLKTKIMECSAKKDGNVREVFRSFIHLSKIPLREQLETEENGGLRRRLSAHAGSKSIQCKSNCSSPSNSKPSTPTTPRGYMCGFSTPPITPASPSSLSPNFLSTEDNSPFGRNKPRSRSLIRRCSKKVKKQVQDATEGPGECRLS